MIEDKKNLFTTALDVVIGGSSLLGLGLAAFFVLLKMAIDGMNWVME